MSVPSSTSENRASRYAVPAAEKAFDILDLLTHQPAGLTLVEIGNSLSRSMGEIYRIAVFLAARGLIAQERGGERYFLTGKLFEMAHRHPPTERLLSLAYPALQRLAQEAEQSCHLAVLDRGAILIISAADSPLPMHHRVRVGSRFDALTTSSGVVLIGHKPDVLWPEWLEAFAPSERKKSLARLRLVKKQGFEQIPSLMVQGVTNISYPVRDHRGEVIAALTIPYLMQKTLTVDLPSACAATARTAEQLSRSLGFAATAEKCADARDRASAALVQLDPLTLEKRK